MGGVLTLQFGVVLIAVLVSAATDVWKFKIHNILTLPLLASGLVYHGVTGGSGALLGGCLGSLCGFCLLVPLYLRGGMGAGDVKLMAAVGAWLGLPMTFYVFIASSLAAGMYAILMIVINHRVQETWTNLKIAWYRFAALSRHLAAEDRIEKEVSREDRRSRIIPFGLMIAFGVIGALVWTWKAAP